MIVDEEDRKDAREIARRREQLGKLKFHPREDAGNVAVMARAARCYEGFIGDDRQMVGHWITEFTGALDSQDPRRISDARALLVGNLDALEAYSPL